MWPVRRWLDEQNSDPVEEGATGTERPAAKRKPPAAKRPLSQLMHKSISEWQEQLEDVELTGDGAPAS